MSLATSLGFATSDYTQWPMFGQLGILFLGSFVACINNTGPGLNLVGPATTYAVLADFQTWVCTWAMLLGRLEIFTLLVILTPALGGASHPPRWRAVSPPSASDLRISLAFMRSLVFPSAGRGNSHGFIKYCFAVSFK